MLDVADQLKHEAFHFLMKLILIEASCHHFIDLFIDPLINDYLLLLHLVLSECGADAVLPSVKHAEVLGQEHVSQNPQPGNH